MAANLTTKLGQLVDVLTPDTTNTRIGVANSSPSRTLDVTGTFGASGASTLGGALTYGGVTLSNAVTGTGNMVLSASPTLTGTLTAAAANFSGAVGTGSLTVNSGATIRQVTFNGGGSNGGYTGYQTNGSDILYIGSAYQSLGSSYSASDAGIGAVGRLYLQGTNITFNNAINYGGVTLSNSVTGTGSMVLSAGPTFTGTTTTNILAVNATTSGATSAMTVKGTTYSLLSIQKGADAQSAGVQLMNAANTQQWFEGIPESSNNRVWYYAPGSTTYMTLDTSGRLQVGTTAGSGRINMANAGGGLHQINSTGGDQEILNLFSDNNLYFSAPSNIIIRPGGGGEAARFNTAGHLLVGTTSDSGILSLQQDQAIFTRAQVTNANASGEAQWCAYNGSSGICTFGVTGTSFTYGMNGPSTGYVYTNSSAGIGFMADNGSAPIKFATGGNSEKARFGSDGSFLVNTTTNGGGVGAKLAVYNTSGWGAYFNNNSSDANGAVIVNVTNTANTFIRFDYAGTSKGSITTNGTSTAYNTSSDARLKDNITDAGDAGSIIDALQVRQWDWKSTGLHQAFGFVAQEEAAVYPDAVTAGDDGDEIERQWSRDDSKLVPLLVKEIQSLRQRLAAAGIA
jgi:hypothetical protein